MEWNKGFTAQYYAEFVDPQTWRDIERFDITGGSIKRADSGLMGSADLNCINYQQETERFVRIWLDTKQNGDSDHVALFTGLASAPEEDINGRLVNSPVVCYSVLKPAEDVLLPLGYYASAGYNGAQLVKELLSACTPAPITITGTSPALSQYIIAENNENYLSMSQKVLAAIGWRLRIEGDGRIEICDRAKDEDASVKFDPLSNDSIEPQLKKVNDWYKCPNVFRAIMDDLSAVARDDSETSPLSTVSRGREVWQEERDCDLNENESLAEYAQRRLEEEQRHYLAVTYDRRFHPDVIASDKIQLHYPEQRIDGIFYVSSQTIALGYGARTSEEVIQV